MRLHTLACTGRLPPENRFIRPGMSAAPGVRSPGWGCGYGTTQAAPISAFPPQNTEKSSSKREVCRYLP